MNALDQDQPPGSGTALDDQTVLITGGAGFLGRTVRRSSAGAVPPAPGHRLQPRRAEAPRDAPGGLDHPGLRYLLGDVRDIDRLRRACRGVDVVVHAAALTEVPACADNPFEAVLTNVQGARNVIEAALDAGVQKVMALSSAQAVHPVNLYGATQLAAEQLFLHAGVYADGAPMGVSVCASGAWPAAPGVSCPCSAPRRTRGA